MTPRAVAVTWATPTCPEVQIWGAVKESQVPAHANPLLATVRTAELLLAKLMGVVMLFPVALCGVPVKVRVVPRSMDALVAGVRVMEAGTGKKVARVGLLPQPENAAISSTQMDVPATCKLENLPKTRPPHDQEMINRCSADGKLSV